MEPIESVFYDPVKEYDRTWGGCRMAAMLDAGTPFHHPRFGSGEFNSMLIFDNNWGTGSYRLDHNGMGLELLRAFESAMAREDCYVGVIDRVKQRVVQAFVLKYIPHPRLVCPCSLYYPQNAGQCYEFHGALARRREDCVLIGPERVREVAQLAGWAFVVAPAKNAYDAIDQLEEECRSMAHPCRVYLTAIGAASECLIGRLTCLPGVTSIDVGHLPQVIAGDYPRTSYRSRRGWSDKYRARLRAILKHEE